MINAAAHVENNAMAAATFAGTHEGMSEFLPEAIFARAYDFVCRV